MREERIMKEEASFGPASSGENICCFQALAEARSSIVVGFLLAIALATLATEAARSHYHFERLAGHFLPFFFLIVAQNRNGLAKEFLAHFGYLFHRAFIGAAAALEE